MTDKSPKEVQDEPGAEERFELGTANALKTPPKPRASLSTKANGEERGEAKRRET